MRAHHLTILELHANATDKEIKSAYRKLSKKYHPDINGTPSAKEHFLAIKDAYDYLMKNGQDEPVSQEPVMSEEEIQRRWRADAQRRRREKAAQEQAKLEALIIRIVRVFRPIGIAILAFNALLTIDFFLPLEEHTQSVKEVRRIFEHSSASRYSGSAGHYRYDEIIFDDFSMTFNRGEIRISELSPNAEVYATAIFQTPMKAELTIGSSQRAFMPSFNIYVVFGYMIPFMIALSTLFFILSKPMHRLNLAIVTFVLVIIQITVYWW